MDLSNTSRNELALIKADLELKYNKFLALKLNFDMTRGKPCKAQLDLSQDMMKISDWAADDGSDCRNYGGVDGIPEAKKLFAEFMDVNIDEIVIGGNSSLNMMYDTIVRNMLIGMPGSEKSWSKLSNPKFLCPSPGYDRHFAICENLGIEMITVEMRDDGPDMNTVERLVAEDDSIKGMWCVPRYSNPTGIVYSEDTIMRLASMKTKAKDFCIMWDNAYNVHHFVENPKPLPNLLKYCKELGNPDRVIMFGSTSKISFAGAGIAFMCGSKRNVDHAKKQIGIQTIGVNKINQLHHVRFYKDLEGIKAIMKKHAAILKPKFDAVLSILKANFEGKGICTWSSPEGGYFISFNTLEGCAKAIIELAGKAGLMLTPAGSAFPYKNDFKDSNIRIAPSFPPLQDIEKAMELFAVCVELTCVNKLLAN